MTDSVIKNAAKLQKELLLNIFLSELLK